MALQLREYIDTNNLSESFQSAYKKNHSTETPLIRVDNDIAMANDSQKIVVLLLLDLSAASSPKQIWHEWCSAQLVSIVHFWSDAICQDWRDGFSSLQARMLFLHKGQSWDHCSTLSTPLLLEILRVVTIWITTCTLTTRNYTLPSDLPLLKTWDFPNPRLRLVFMTLTNGCFTTSWSWIETRQSASSLLYHLHIVSDHRYNLYLYAME